MTRNKITTSNSSTPIAPPTPPITAMSSMFGDSPGGGGSTVGVGINNVVTGIETLGATLLVLANGGKVAPTLVLVDEGSRAGVDVVGGGSRRENDTKLKTSNPIPEQFTPAKPSQPPFTRNKRTTFSEGLQSVNDSSVPKQSTVVNAGS